MIYLHWIVVLVFWLYVIVILATSAVVVMENRQPVKTMAWLLVLILLPVVGLVIGLLWAAGVWLIPKIAIPVWVAMTAALPWLCAWPRATTIRSAPF